jgi:hypothetical protein
VVDHRHLADKGDIVKMAKVWVDARDYLFILVSQSLQRGHTKLCSHFNKSEKYVFYIQLFGFIAGYGEYKWDTEGKNKYLEK